MSACAQQRRTEGRRMSGLILIQQSCPVAMSIEQLILIWAVTEAEEWEGIVRFLPL
jgi:hypothetical protein